MPALLAALLAGVSMWLALTDDGLGRLLLGRPRRSIAEGRSPRFRIRLLTHEQAERERLLLQALPAVCELLAVGIRAGQPPRGALRALAQVSSEPTKGVLSAVWNQIELGVPEPQAWASLAEHEAYRGVARDLAQAVRSGAALADLLRERAREARTASGALALARARRVAVTGVLPLVLCYLPAFLLVGVVPVFGGFLGQLLGG